MALDGVVEQVVVVGHRGLAHVARRDRRVVQQLAWLPPPDGSGQVVGLVDVQIGVVERGDRSGVVQERAPVPVVGLEVPPVRDVRPRVTVVVDLDVVVRVLGPQEEVRASRRLLEGDPGADERDRVRAGRGSTNAQTSVLSICGSAAVSGASTVAGRDAGRGSEPGEQTCAQRHRRRGRESRVRMRVVAKTYSFVSRDASGTDRLRDVADPSARRPAAPPFRCEAAALRVDFARATAAGSDARRLLNELQLQRSSAPTRPLADDGEPGQPAGPSGAPISDRSRSVRVPRPSQMRVAHVRERVLGTARRSR